MASVWLERRRNRRPQHGRAGEAPAADPGSERQAGRHRCEHREGQGCVVHGRRQQLALPHTVRGRGQGGETRAGGIGMRNAFADEITKLGADDTRVVLLSGDIGNKLFDKFKQQAGNRFLNCGVAEANMMSIAAGMALSGLRPVIYTITPFTTTRCFEQIRVDVCYHKAPVIIVGTGSGLSYADLGPTHHSCEDMAILRTRPGMTVLAPADSTELRLALRQALSLGGPVYMRIGKKGEPA